MRAPLVARGFPLPIALVVHVLPTRPSVASSEATATVFTVRLTRAGGAG